MGAIQAVRASRAQDPYGAGLSRFLRERGHTIVEVNRPNRQLRYQQGKSDAVDAESAARAVLAGRAAGQPKSGTGTVEMIRHLKIARDTAVKARTQAMQTLKAIIVCSPDALREQARPGQRWQDHAFAAAGSLAAGPAHFHAGVGQGEPCAQSPGAGAAAGCRDQAARRSPTETLTADRAPRTAGSARDGLGHRGRDAAACRRQS